MQLDRKLVGLGNDSGKKLRNVMKGEAYKELEEEGSYAACWRMLKGALEGLTGNSFTKMIRAMVRARDQEDSRRARRDRTHGMTIRGMQQKAHQRQRQRA